MSPYAETALSPYTGGLQCLKRYGQRLDLEIAAGMRVPLATVRKRLSELGAAGDVVMCRLTR